MPAFDQFALKASPLLSREGEAARHHRDVVRFAQLDERTVVGDLERPVMSRPCRRGAGALRACQPDTRGCSRSARCRSARRPRYRGRWTRCPRTCSWRTLCGIANAERVGRLVPWLAAIAGSGLWSYRTGPMPLHHPYSSSAAVSSQRVRGTKVLPVGTFAPIPLPSVTWTMRGRSPHTEGSSVNKEQNDATQSVRCAG